MFSMFLIYVKISIGTNFKLVETLQNFIILSIGSILGLISVILFFIINHLTMKSLTPLLRKRITQTIIILLLCLLVHQIHQILEFDLDII